LFTAGKDATGTELLYAPVRTSVIGPAKVESLRTISLDGEGTVRFAPIANSADGVGGALPEGEPRWAGFGHDALPTAEIGFAVASPTLRLSEGERTVTLELTLAGVAGTGLTTAKLDGAFSVFLTGAEGWVQPEGVEVTLAGSTLRLVCSLSRALGAVADYQQAVHGYAYAAAAPVMQVQLAAGARVGYADFAGVIVTNAKVSVSAAGVTSLTLESDAGTIDPKKAFLPFGPQPTAGSKFLVAYPEALNKKLSSLSLALTWKDAPTSFATRYAGYGVSGVTNAYFTASASFDDAAPGAGFQAAGVRLFNTTNATLAQTLSFTPGAAVSQGGGKRGEILALRKAGAQWSLLRAERRALAEPVHGTALSIAPAERQGFVTLTLEKGFLHAEYRKKQIENVLALVTPSTNDDPSPAVLFEPYTPTVQSISLSYAASTDRVGVSSTTMDDFANPDLQFFHLAPFGPMREHGYQRAQLSFIGSTDVPLLPAFTHAGELLIGLGGTVAGDGVSLLFQVAPGSADPELPRERLQWYALADNYWKPLGPGELVLDTTRDLLASGIIKLVIPPEATTLNTVLPAGPVWIRAAVAGESAAVSQLVEVAASGVEVALASEGYDPAHLDAPLAAGKISKLKYGLAGVKSVKQPYASFGGRGAEQAAAFHTRAAERLRHRDRCVTRWDYERIVLEAFPGVHRVKCIPHAREGSWMAPGHVMLVVVPDLRNQNAVDPLQPRVDADTLDQILTHVQARAGMQVQVAVKNPSYQKVRLDFQVRFRTGYDFNHYRVQLQDALVQALSPWAFADGPEIGFGGAVYRSVLMDLVEELPYVDYVTEFRMFSWTGDVVDRTDRDVARPATPDAILVSDAAHTITEAP
ncbi:MAG TPA: baseplate J/gp47 family protein, partial [Longimicrobium sp.]|nr:baseplate J/gp47 family protein [Longimicrobium sp.]